MCPAGGSKKARSWHAWNENNIKTSQPFHKRYIPFPTSESYLLIRRSSVLIPDGHPSFKKTTIAHIKLKMSHIRKISQITKDHKFFNQKSRKSQPLIYITLIKKIKKYKKHTKNTKFLTQNTKTKIQSIFLKILKKPFKIS